MPRPGPLALLRAPRSLVVAAAALVVALLLALGIAGTPDSASTAGIAGSASQTGPGSSTSTASSSSTASSTSIASTTSTASTTSAAALGAALESATVALVDAAPHPFDGGSDGHDVGTLCLAATCLLLVLTVLIPALRRPGGPLAVLSRAAREALPRPAALLPAPRLVATPTRC